MTRPQRAVLAAWPIAAFLCVFVLSRVLWRMQWLAPDDTIILSHWQAADFALLAQAPIQTLIELHAQPPLWNALLALAAQAGEGDPARATGFVHVLHMAMTATVGILAILTLRRLGAPGWLAAGAAVLMACLPQTAYYENLVAYAHLTFFLSAVFVFAIVRVRAGGPRWPAALAMLILVLLSWTWALFHPALSAVLMLGVAAIHAGGWRLGRLALAGVTAAAALAALPALRNGVAHGLPTGSTWAGYNLAQTTTGFSPELAAACSFDGAMAQLLAEAPQAGDGGGAADRPFKASGDPNFNHRALVAPSRACLAAAKADILAHPLDWAAGRAAALLRSHQRQAWEYDFSPPGWREVFAPVLALHANHQALARGLAVGVVLVLLLFAVRRRGEGAASIWLVAAYIVGVTLAGHLFNGAEQERMRYTVEPAYWWLLADGVSRLAQARAKRARQSPARGWTAETGWTANAA